MLYCVFTAQSLVFFHHYSSPLYPLQPAPAPFPLYYFYSQGIESKGFKELINVTRLISGRSFKINQSYSKDELSLALALEMANFF